MAIDLMQRKYECEANTNGIFHGTSLRYTTARAITGETDLVTDADAAASPQEEAMR